MTGTTSPSSATPPVVIVGAGPTGVTVATLLAQHGVDSLVLDRWAGVYPQPRAVHLDDEVYRVVARLGLAEEFAAISRPSLGLRLVDRGHRVLAQFDRSGPAPANGHPRASMFDQPELEQLLRTNLEHHPGVTVRGNVEVTDVRQTDPDRVEVALVDRLSGAAETLHARFVLGCDGANSVVRTAIGSAYEDLDFEQRWLVVDVETTADLDQWEGVHQVCDGRRAATYMRVGETRYRWEFQLLDGESAADFQIIRRLRPLIDPWVRGIGDEELDLVRVADYVFRAQLADRWRAGNVLLLGDAAHLTPPFIGQGMGAGMRDAANLAWKLAGVVEGSLPVDVLDSYEQERRPHARDLIVLARVIGVLMTSGGVVGEAARQVLLPPLTRVPGLRARFVDSETPPLGGSAWIARPRRGRPEGRLVPRAEVDGTDLDETLGHSWAVVTTQPAAPSDRQALARVGCRVVLVEADHPLGRWLTTHRARAVLVRPDRTVLASSDRVSELCGTLTSTT